MESTLGHLCNVAAICSTIRYRSIKSVETTNSNDPGTVARCELDSHADTCVAGPNFQLDEYTGDFCDVTPYSADFQPLTNIPVVNASTVFTDDVTGETVILRFNQVIWYGSRLDMSLINPNQIRHSGLVVSDDPMDKTRTFGVTGDGFHIPFSMQGTTVYFESHVPTKWEYENCRIIELTVDTPWNPGEVNISATASNKLTMEQVMYQNVCALDRIPRCAEPCTDRCACVSDLSILEPESFIRRMVSAVLVATAHCDNDDVQLAFVGAKDRHSQVSAETVACKLRCGLETAQRTLTTTTQRGVRNTIHPLHRRYRVDHLNLHRKRLRDVFYMDTLFSKVKSLSGFTCAQLITNGSFTRVYPMESKASSNIATVLQEFIDDVGLPEILVCDCVRAD
jgi:hypothetical protein